MSNYFQFSLIIPLWNEASNLPQLVSSIEQSGLACEGMAELILVNNGSTDGTGPLVNQLAEHRPWIVPIHLPQNENYGGGVYRGMEYSKFQFVCYIPGDLQVLPADVIRIARVFADECVNGSKLLVKGYRTIRHDPLQTRFVSSIFTKLANLVLGLRVEDVNGLPKMFNRDLLDLLPEMRMKTFVFDAQLISLVRVHKWRLIETPVTFHSRRTGISSWSSKRISVYIQVFKSLFRLRALRNAPPVPLQRLR